MDLKLNRSTDAIVMGGGLIGCSIALRLAQAGRSVAIFERSEPGCEASSAGAGMIAPQGETTEPDDFYYLCAASRDLYAAFAAEVEELSGESVFFCREGTLFAALDDKQEEELDRIFTAQSKAGLPVTRLSAADALRRAPQLNRDVRGALDMPGDYRVDNERLAFALAQACRRTGVVFHSHTTVTRLTSRNGRVEAIEAHNESGPASYSAGTFVLAAGAWSAELASTLGISIPMTPCRGQLIEFTGAEDFCVTLRAGHCYLVPRSAGRLVVGSIMEYVGFEKAVTGGGLNAIIEAAVRLAPRTRGLIFRRAWSGFRPDTADHLPVLGRSQLPNLVIATGHFRNGILLTPITAKLISELILHGSPSIPLDAYSPLRFDRRKGAGSTG
ncbi:MAG: glycine oxidase ThiO [Acidobacteriota bacterium]|nr:glycine oxidase ThiO [Acidobacteriota bacterium]